MCELFVPFLLPSGVQFCGNAMKFIHLFVGGHLGSFQLLLITNKAAIDICEQKTTKKTCKFSYIALELVANKQLLRIFLFKLPLKSEITLFNMTVFNTV